MTLHSWSALDVASLVFVSGCGPRDPLEHVYAKGPVHSLRPLGRLRAQHMRDVVSLHYQSHELAPQDNNNDNVTRSCGDLKI